MITPYRILLSIHLIGIISWMAGVLYLYRLFVYHAQETESVVKERFQIMERRLSHFITMPAMAISFVAGISMLLLSPSLFSQPWMHAKLFFVFCLMAITGHAETFRKKFRDGKNKITAKTYRWLNEIPTLLMIAIVFLVILRPF